LAPANRLIAFSESRRVSPLPAEAVQPCRHCVGDRWSVDETYVKVAGRWRYVYRAIDQFGQIIARRRMILHGTGPTVWAVGSGRGGAIRWR
jgi:transposase InsO family protein